MVLLQIYKKSSQLKKLQELKKIKKICLIIVLTLNVSTIFLVKNINHALFKIIPNIGRTNCRQVKPYQKVFGRLGQSISSTK